MTAPSSHQISHTLRVLQDRRGLQVTAQQHPDRVAQSVEQRTFNAVATPSLRSAPIVRGTAEHDRVNALLCAFVGIVAHNLAHGGGTVRRWS